MDFKQKERIGIMGFLSQINPVYTTRIYLYKIYFNIKNAVFWNVEPCGFIKKTPLCRPSDRRLSLKLMPTFADEGCHVVGVTGLYDHILGFLDRSRYFFI
jgi:hypothetical protein